MQNHFKTRNFQLCIACNQYIASKQFNKHTKMPKASKNSAQEEAQMPTQQETNETSQDELPSSDQESETEVTFNPPRQQPQVIPSMFMPYTEGPRMDWTVNDGLYHRFLKWHLKCENILECELAALPER